MAHSQASVLFAALACLLLASGCGRHDQAGDSADASSSADAGLAGPDAAGTGAGDVGALPADASAPDSGLAKPDAGASCAVDTSAREVRDVPYDSLAGVAPNLLSLDLYLPQRASACALAPVVVWVHGGAWAIGDKANGMADKKALFNGEGWLLASVNYRLSPEQASTDPDRVMYPAHPRDVAAALAWLHEHVATYGGDPSRMALLGHSAGAHIAALVSTDESFLAGHGLPVATLSCTGSYDTEGYDIAASLKTASAQNRQIYENAFGTDPAVWALASPITHVAAGKGIPPFQLARRGAADRRANCDAFAAALQAAGVAVDVIDASGLTHEEVNDRIGQAGDTVMTAQVMAFLRPCLAP